MKCLALLAAVACFPFAGACSSAAPSSAQPEPVQQHGDAAVLSLTHAVDAAALTPGANAACAPTGKPLFASAICVCGDYSQAGALVTVPENAGAASVGVNGDSAVVSSTSIGGSFVPYGGLSITGPTQVADDLVSAADVTGAGTLQVGHDLDVGGHLSFAGTLTVGGDLRAPDATLIAGESIGGYGPFTAPAVPCGCGASQILDVAAAVQAAALHNDNAKNGFSSTGMDMVGPSSITLTEGSYYIQQVGSVGVAALTIDGAVSLYIGGSLSQGGVDKVVLLTGATLDLYVEGAVATAGSVTYGDVARPDAFRLYVGGAGSTILTAGSQVFHGLVYAPSARLSFSGVTEVDGALFADSLAWSGTMRVQYSGGAGSSQGTCSPPTSTDPK
jgi:hypothetical protein